MSTILKKLLISMSEVITPFKTKLHNFSYGFGQKFLLPVFALLGKVDRGEVLLIWEENTARKRRGVRPRPAKKIWYF